MSTTRPEQQERTARRAGLKLVVAASSVCIALLVLLVVLEFGLRVWGYGIATGYFVQRQSGGQTVYAVNRNFYQQFLSMPIENIVGGDDLGFETPVAKAPNAFRVFLFGSSAAHGCTPDYAFGMSRILETMLTSRFPNIKFEIYNAACPALNSHVMRFAAEACARLKPDLFLVYMGNNEFYGPFGPAWLGDRRVTPGYVGRWVMLHRLRLVQWTTARAGGLPHTDTGKSFFEMLQRFPADAPVKNQMVANYRYNLEAICRSGTNAGAKVALCTVPDSIADWRPFDSLHRAGIAKDELARWDEAVRRGDERMNAQDPGGALAAYRQAEALDNTYAGLHFKMARCLIGLQEFDNAREAYVRARDLDALQMRADTLINEIIADVAKGSNVTLIDVASELEAKSPNRIVDSTFFWDFVHLNFAGNYLVAAAMFKEVTALLPESSRKTDAQPPSETECARRLGLTPSVMAEHARKMLPAFTYWGVAQENLDWLNARIAELETKAGPDATEKEAEGYRHALTLTGDDYYLLSRYVQALVQLGKLDQALEEARKLVAKFPSRPGSQATLDGVLQKMGKDPKQEHGRS